MIYPELRDLLHGFGTYEDLRDTHVHLDDAAYDNLVLDMIQILEPELQAYIDSLPYPTKKADMYKPAEIMLLPEHIRMHVIEFLDSKIDASLVVEKVMMYMNICQDVMDTILHTYEQRWKETLTRHGLTPDTGIDLLDKLTKNN